MPTDAPDGDVSVSPVYLASSTFTADPAFQPLSTTARPRNSSLNYWPRHCPTAVTGVKFCQPAFIFDVRLTWHPQTECMESDPKGDSKEEGRRESNPTSNHDERGSRKGFRVALTLTSAAVGGIAKAVAESLLDDGK